MPDITEHQAWAHGDATLVSADNVRFRVPAYYLLSASAVLRDGHDDGRVNIDVHLTDEELETARNLHHFLVFLTEHRVDGGVLKPGDEKDPGEVLGDLYCAQRLRGLIRLLDKYGCDGMLSTLRLQLETDGHVHRSDTHAAYTAYSLFVAGAELGDEGLCSSALRRRTSYWRDGEDETASADPNKGTLKYHKLNPMGMPVEMYDFLPHDYRYALTRAWAGHRPHDDVSARFQMAITSLTAHRSRKRRRSARSDADGEE